MQSPEQKTIVQHLKDEYAVSGRVLSVRNICAKFSLDTKSFYRVFAEGKREACKLAGIPEDRKSFERIKKAAEAVRNKREKESTETEEIKSLMEKADEIAKEVKRAQAIVESHQNIRKLETTLESTREGRKQIFSHPNRLLEFSARMIEHESVVTSDLSVWDSFVAYCKTHSLDLAGKLLEVAGPLDEYEEHADEDVLHNYLGFKLEAFLIDRETEQKQKAMQKKFEDILRNFRCECGRDVSTAYMVDNVLCCPCGSTWNLLCVNCKKELRFDAKTEALVCHACGMSFRFVVHG